MYNAKVYIGGLPRGCTERDVEDFVCSYGYVNEIFMKEQFAFVQFADRRDAEEAVFELDGKEILGEVVRVEHARPRRGGSAWEGNWARQRRQGNRLIVENLSSQTTWQDLKDFMRQAGDVTYADAHKVRRNQGIVQFASYSDMMNALETLDDAELGGRRIALREERKRSRRSRSDSRSTIDTYRFRAR